MPTATPGRKMFAAIFLILLACVGGGGVWERRAALRPAALAGAAGGRMAAIDRVLTAALPGRESLLAIRSRLQDRLGDSADAGFTLLRDRNGVLNVGSPFPPDTSQLHELAARLYWLKRYAAGSGTRMIYLTPPDRVVKGYSEYSRGLPYRNLNPVQDSFLFYIGEYGVDYLDARAALAESGLTPAAWLFRTDSRWTPTAAFATFQRLLPEMDRRFGMDLDPDKRLVDPENYEFVKIPHPFLGDLGRMAGKEFSGLDAFTAVAPKFENRYAVEWVGLDGSYRTGAGATLLHPAALRFEDLDTFAPYDYYLSGLKSWALVKNVEHPEKPSLLLLHDRDGAVLLPLLAPAFGETHAILSAPGEYAVNIDQYLASNHFDFIIVALGPTSYTEAGMNFFIGPKD